MPCHVSDDGLRHYHEGMLLLGVGVGPGSPPLVLCSLPAVGWRKKLDHCIRCLLPTARYFTRVVDQGCEWQVHIKFKHSRVLFVFCVHGWSVDMMPGAHMSCMVSGQFDACHLSCHLCLHTYQHDASRRLACIVVHMLTFFHPVRFPTSKMFLEVVLLTQVSADLLTAYGLKLG
jgi:hypothetical protein